MKIKYIQVDCHEEINTPGWIKPDLRQAECVLKYKPDIIIFELGADKTPDTIYNNYSPKDKPLKLVKERQKWLKKVSKKPGNGDAISDVVLWDNITKVWNEGHNILIYNTDGSDELRKEFFEVWKYMYPCALRNWLWWVQIYLREKYMTKNIQWILEKNKDKESLVVVIFLQSFHWKHVSFLLKNPSKKEIWEYYFSNFKEVNKSNITEKIKKENKVLYKYWQKISDFK